MCVRVASYSHKMFFFKIRDLFAFSKITFLEPRNISSPHRRERDSKRICSRAPRWLLPSLTPSTVLPFGPRSCPKRPGFTRPAFLPCLCLECPVSQRTPWQNSTSISRPRAGLPWAPPCLGGDAPAFPSVFLCPPVTPPVHAEGLGAPRSASCAGAWDGVRGKHPRAHSFIHPPCPEVPWGASPCAGLLDSREGSRPRPSLKELTNTDTTLGPRHSW